ncbi:hypothetical protein SacmaDRAFT_1854 [Saccharomonospora marina XMU15]|uniref:Uncharacterized protein n=1 Tax=Saccharomonospora marina XMU15 TaxID=882083 RepID=H5X6H4_9PSEU|nr:hypothetical protein [Saccharomonospora marina]EHR50122.1 hypothetical protein SacmaDRAFT_1854 [Saccharomonospora marina XMU15]
MLQRIKVICTDHGRHAVRNLGWLLPEVPILDPSPGDLAAWLVRPQQVGGSLDREVGSLDSPETRISFVPWAPGSPARQARDGERLATHETIRPKCPKCRLDVPMRQETARRCFAALADTGMSMLDISRL